MSPQIYEIYTKAIVPLVSENEGVSRKDIRKRYYEIFCRHLQRDRLEREILPSLESAGLISQEPNPDNKREMLVYPTVIPHISPDREYVGRISGVGSSVEPSALKGEKCSSVVSISAAPSISEGDLIPRLREFTSFRNDTSFKYVAKQLGGLSDHEAKNLFNQLTREGKLAQDPDGVWKWVT